MISNGSFTLNGTRFILTQDPASRTTPDSVVFLKTAEMLALYDQLFERVAPRRIVEFGIFEGGSPLYFAATKDIDLFVGIDLRPRSEIVLGHVKSMGLSEKISLHYGVSQGDRAAVEAVLDAEFGSNPLDMVIDDASHQLALSRASFEIAFPRLRPGGVYVLEDWGWAHWAGAFQQAGGQWHDMPALTTLVFEVTMAMASNPRLISKVEIGSGSWLFITRGEDPIPLGFSLAGTIRNRGKALPEI